MPDDVVRIMDESWDRLILLDACRYDVFEKIRQDCLPEGRVSCRQSIGSATTEWRDNSFPDVYPEVVYVSSNPYINSQKAVSGFAGADHFFQVIDVWKTGWDPIKGTVLPQTITREALKAIRRWPDKKTIIHYLQPHAPYLEFGSDCAGFPVPDMVTQQVLRGTTRTGSGTQMKTKIYGRLYPVMKKISCWGNHPDWLLSQALRLPPCSPMDMVRRKYGKKGLRRAYEENLSAVLKEIVQLIRYLSGDIVITSDHGEYLGEDCCYSHFAGSDSPYLRNIPWWTVRKEMAEPSPEPEADFGQTPDIEDDEIQKRLKDLGYL